MLSTPRLSLLGKRICGDHGAEPAGHPPVHRGEVILANPNVSIQGKIILVGGFCEERAVFNALLDSCKVGLKLLL